MLLRPRLVEEETAVAQVRALGHDPADVTDIVLTHMDFDHVGGLGDFPQATVHVYAADWTPPPIPGSASGRGTSRRCGRTARAGGRSRSSATTGWGCARLRPGPGDLPADDRHRPPRPDGEPGPGARATFGAPADVDVLCAHAAADYDRFTTAG
jgi:glyoxylase-like metal-dependent hydrolase (beta-lactamase superfamily II)